MTTIKNDVIEHVITPMLPLISTPVRCGSS